jgi:hypothetical protein
LGRELDIYGQTEFNDMPPEERDALFKAKDGAKVTPTTDTVVGSKAASKFSELESLFTKKNTEEPSSP